MVSLRRIALLLVALCLCAVSTAQAQPKLIKKDKVRVAFALLDTINDQGWTTAHYKGIQHLKEVMGDKVEIAYTEKLFSPADAERVMRKYAEEGYDIIFATTFGHMDPALNVAKDFPNTVFEHCSGYKTAPNMGNYFARMEQAEYLAGYMAGLMGFKNVGTVATQPIPEPVRGINAFTIGLIKGLTEAGQTVPATPVTVAWLKAWRDPINETTLAETMVA
ncbi:MAG: BMP family ABC transporter substrate-binding protein, partial [Desulfovibrio sp.]|nr:BMP family ABC transporter substrate-binding protein [Desulfovibrio sp.]